MALPRISTALFADAKGKPVVKDFPVPLPRDDEILIEVLYSGVNPSDFRTLKVFNCRERVLGNEFCGKVLDSPGLARSPFQVGDIIAGYVDGSNDRPWRYGTHQRYISIPPAWAFKVPDNLPHASAAALTIVVQTANDALFNRLRIPLPSEVTGPTDGTLVIWGAGTSVGMAAIQLARASRVGTIIATASPKRHEFLRSLGATHCFDYNDESTIESIRALVQNASTGPIWGFDAIGTIDTPDSQDFLAKSIPSSDRVILATVLLLAHEGFESSLAARHFEVSFDLPNGEHLHIPSNQQEADRMWKALDWVVTHYGTEYQPTPVRIFKGLAEDALKEVEAVESFGTFGKLVLALPWADVTQ